MGHPQWLVLRIYFILISISWTLVQSILFMIFIVAGLIKSDIIYGTPSKCLSQWLYTRKKRWRLLRQTSKVEPTFREAAKKVIFCGPATKAFFLFFLSGQAPTGLPHSQPLSDRATFLQLPSTLWYL